MTQKTPKKSRYMESLALAVACGSTVKAAAESVGCSLGIAYSLSRSTEFRDRVSEIRRASLEATVGVLTAAASKAAATLVRLLDDPDPKIQLAAATRLFASIGPMTETHDLRADIQELREQLKQQPPRLAVGT